MDKNTGGHQFPISMASWRLFSWESTKPHCLLRALHSCIWIEIAHLDAPRSLSLLYSLLELSPLTSDPQANQKDVGPMNPQSQVDIRPPKLPASLGSSPIIAAEVSEESFTLNFTINNLRYSADMSHRGSLKFNITDTLMQHLVRDLFTPPISMTHHRDCCPPLTNTGSLLPLQLSLLFRRSSLGPRYAGCKVISLR